MNDVEIAGLGNAARLRRLHRGESIFDESETAGTCASIVSGVVKLKKRLPNGRQQIVGLGFEADFLGRPDKEDLTLAARAASDVQLCFVRKQDLLAAMRRFPVLANRLLQITLDQLAEARDWMLLLGRKTAEERVASFICMMAGKANATRVGSTQAPSTTRFDILLTRAEIADYLGMTSETVSRALARLQLRGLIQIEPGRTVSVSNLARLEQFADDVAMLASDGRAPQEC